jgi:predicted amidohydrolase YtcJ
MFFQIPRCYDSHLHLLATGQVESTLDLSRLTSAEAISQMMIKKQFYRGEWLTGAGWDQHSWPEQKFPDKKVLDKVFPDQPVAFYRADGHALWVNSRALDLAGLQGNGLLLDTEMFPVEKVIPPLSGVQKKNFLLAGIAAMNRQGFTHLRDMSGDTEQWQILRELDLSGNLTLYIDQNFYLESIKELSNVIAAAKSARQAETKHLRVSAIKFFHDGALGSEGAYLSQNYGNSDKCGFAIWNLSEMRTAMTAAWQNGFEVAVHAIGDRAAHDVALIARDVWQSGVRGILNIEHGEVIRRDTIDLLKTMNTVVHMQPCHWLSDRKWLKEKLGDLYQHVFPWSNLAAAGIPVRWGSDTPVEKPILQNNLQALRLSAEDGIAAFPGNPLHPHSHPQENWGADCRSSFENGRPVSVIFDGQELKL